MADQIEQVSEQGFGSNIMDSIKGVLVGVVLFFASFWVLWMNEGRVDLSEVAKKSVVVKADSVDKGAEGKFVSVTGDLKNEGKVEDPDLLAAGDYIRLDRQVEMWAWIERKNRDEKKKVGGSKEVKTTYTYETKWTDEPWPPSKFEYAKGHENPPLPIESKTFFADKAMVGAYAFKPADAQLPGGDQLTLTDDMLKGQKADAAKADGDKADAAKTDGDKADADKGGGDKKDDAADDGAKKKGKKSKKRSGRKAVRNKPSAAEKQAAGNVAEKKAAAVAASKPEGYPRASDTYLFRGTGKLDTPEVGDVRIGFKALKPGGQVTIFGALNGDEIKTYASSKDDVKLFRVLKGSREEAIQTLATEHKTTTWILRILGFLMMWFGLMMFFGPINALLDVIPFLGSAGRFLIGIVMFPVSLILSTVTILLSVIFHNTILLIIFLAAMGAGAYFLYQKKKKG